MKSRKGIPATAQTKKRPNRGPQKVPGYAKGPRKGAR